MNEHDERRIERIPMHLAPPCEHEMRGGGRLIRSGQGSGHASVRRARRWTKRCPNQAAFRVDGKNHCAAHAPAAAKRPLAEAGRA